MSKGKVPKEAIRVEINKPPTEADLQKGIMKSSFLTETLTDQSRIDALKTYGKYIIVRHPLQRILSGYLDKIRGFHLLSSYANNDKMQRIIHDIVQMYHPKEYSLWSENKINSTLEVTFVDYISWLTETDLISLNEHFSPQYYNSQPCRVRYHFYGNFDNFKEDFTLILQQFGINDISVIKSLPTVKKGASLEKVDEFWSSLPTKLKQKLLKTYKIDFDFYHALYPWEISLTNRYFKNLM